MMRTILVPTDLSETAKNAAKFAIEYACDQHADRIVLYHAYQPPLHADPAMPSIEFINIEELKKDSEEGLQRFMLEVKAFCPVHIALDTKNDFSLLSENIDEICRQEKADLIIMGITGGGKIEEALIGSNTISVAERTTIPVIIVPPQCSYTGMQKVVLACDLKKVVETTPVDALRSLLDEAQPKLYVINISGKAKSNDDAPFESLMLDTLLQGYSPEYHFIHNENFTEAINEFALENQIDLIITIPKKHGWFEGLFRKSHTKALAFHSNVPLMVIHE